ncbi:hypothetical protein EJ08DRAFT_577360 [Tothia fuscella]|uniref:Uncharacterized protein n=1 Tax=Tothia fuscella TaxID=1048955 RepID=A0A9P4P3Q2_9PEZI|nr:hypothetical protein EJ08DRAFT_577360 [Tothia fuscella]
MSNAPPIFKLANEVLDLILDYLEAESSKSINVDRRAYLSQESFASPTESTPDLGNWRRTCKRFSEIGVTHQFAIVETRFSRDGFKRLLWLAGQQHLVQHVKKFTYFMPYFYVVGQQRLGSLPVPEGIRLQDTIIKMKEQTSIVNNKEDLTALTRALSAFTSLQHIKILPLHDDEEDKRLEAMRQYLDFTQSIELRWAPAFSHSARIIGQALVDSHSPFKRFSSPMLSPQSLQSLPTAIVLAPEISNTMTELALRLTCLELHFHPDDNIDLDFKMRELSPVFRTVFTAARNLEAVHMGFPSHRPLTIGLEELFHNVQWDGLLAFGIQGWKLDEEEIMARASRHKEKLRGLRLRDVLLNEGSKWKNVLGYLRNNMRSLDWVSLRRIGYVQAFDEHMSSLGGEVPDDPPGGFSDSDDEFDDYDEHTTNGHMPNGNQEDHNHDHDDEYSDQETTISASSHDGDGDDDENGVAANEFHIPYHPDAPRPLRTWCNCDDNRAVPATADELGDDGSFACVRPEMRKLWESWVVNRCPVHNIK